MVLVGKWGDGMLLILPVSKLCGLQMDRAASGSVKKFVSLVKNGSFSIRSKIWKFLSKRSIS